MTSARPAGGSDPGRRRAGLVVPLFSCPSTTSWGIGDIGDLAPLTAWLAGAGQRVLQILPLNEMAAGQHSPYFAVSAMAIDPIYIRLPAVPEFAAVGGEQSLSASDRQELEHVRAATSVDYVAVRRLKETALRTAFDRFYEAEWRRETERGQALQTFLTSRAWWIEDYAIFRALYQNTDKQPWMDWPAPLRAREPAAIAQARRDLSGDVLFFQYLQWLADTQWHEARQAANAHGVALFGDLPFMVDSNSADVWARSEQFRLDASVGAPPDAFSSTGQDWGLPVCRWNMMEVDDFRWLRSRAKRSADLFDGYRIDHLVGFYRTYCLPRDGSDPHFTPGTEREQTALGEKMLGIFRDAGAEIVAEDLGTVPDFVRASLKRQGIAGLRVLRWEREWHAEGHPFRDPADYPARSVGVSGTHDTAPLADWWEEASAAERAAIDRLPTIRALAGDSSLAAAPYDPLVRDTLLEALFASGSDLTLITIGDVFGWRDRINEPGTVSDANWTFRMPWPADRLDEITAARDRQQALRGWAARHGRLGACSAL